MSNLLDKARATKSVGLVIGKADTPSGHDKKAAGDGNLKFRALGVIYSRGERADLRDLEGDKFLPDISTMRSQMEGESDETILRNIATDYGVEEKYLIPGQTKVPVLWDHGRGVLGRARIGWATFEKLSDEGLQFLIEIERDNVRRYDQFVEYWWNQKTLGCSSQAMSSTFDYDWEHGLIRSWWPVELSLTNVPALPTTREEVALERTAPAMTPTELARSLGIKTLSEEPMSEEHKNAEVVEETPQEEIQADAGEQRTVSEELGDAVTELAGELDKSTEATVLDAVVAVLKDIRSKLDDLGTRMDTLEADGAKAADVEELRSRIDAANQDLVEGVKTSFKSLGGVLADRVKSLAVETVISASEVELDVDRSNGHTASPAKSHVRGQGFAPSGRPANMGQ